MVIQDYYKQALLTDKYMKRDHNAAIKIQRMWRRHVVRSKYIRIQYFLNSQNKGSVSDHTKIYAGIPELEIFGKAEVFGKRKNECMLF